MEVPPAQQAYREQFVRLCLSVSESAGRQGSAFESDAEAQDRILATSLTSKGLPMDRQVEVSEMLKVIKALERIIFANSQRGPLKDKSRHFRAVAEFYKFLRGDPRIFSLYEPVKREMTEFAIADLYQAGDENSMLLAKSFVNFMLRFYTHLEFADFVGSDTIPPGIQMKFQIEDARFRDLIVKTMATRESVV